MAKVKEQQLDYRERLLEVRRMRAGDIQENPRNPKIHPETQTAPLAGVLADVGKVDILKAYHSERAGGALVYWDGHARRNLRPDEVWNVGIYDLTDSEADYLLSTFDPVGWQATQSAVKLNDLLRDVSTGQAAVMEMLGREAERCGAVAASKDAGDKEADYGEKPEEGTEDYADRTIKRVTLFFGLSEYDDFLQRLNAVCKQEGVDNHTDAVARLLEFYEDNRSATAEAEFR